MNSESPRAFHVLLVDDNAMGITARKVILQEQGYHVETALSGEEAWEIYQKKSYDVVVTDFRMHGMDGLELIRLIHGSGKQSRVILLSGLVGCLGMTESSTGADEVICKSNREVQDLLRSVKRLCAKQQRRGPASERAKKTEVARSAGSRTL